MELKDYLYNYVNNFFVDQVMFTICSENYEGKDADKNYIEYVKAYDEISKTLLHNTEDKVMAGLKICREHVAKGYNEFALDKLFYTIELHKNINEEEKRRINEELKGVIKGDVVNKELIKNIREIEERYLGGNLEDIGGEKVVNY